MPESPPAPLATGASSAQWSDGGVHVPSFHSDGVGQDGQDLLIMMLDQQAELPSVQRMRAWAAQVLAVKAGRAPWTSGRAPGRRWCPRAGRRTVGNSRRGGSQSGHGRGGDLAGERLDGFGSCRAPPTTCRSPTAVFDAVRCERVFQPRRSARGDPGDRPRAPSGWSRHPDRQ